MWYRVVILSLAVFFLILMMKLCMVIGVVKVHPFYAVINTCLKTLNITEPLTMLFTKPPGVFCRLQEHFSKTVPPFTASGIFRNCDE